jgi:hypothetical protein
LQPSYWVAIVPVSCVIKSVLIGSFDAMIERADSVLIGSIDAMRRELMRKDVSYSAMIIF